MVALAKKRHMRRERKNEMKKLMMIAVAALCCVVLADGPERGERRPGGPRGGMGGMRHHEMMGMDPIVFAVSRPQVVEKLGLSDEQKEKLKAVTDRAKDGREGMKKVREATMKQFDLMKADKVDEAAVMKAIDEVFELRKQMAKDQVRRVIEIKAILTPEQIAKAREEMKSGFEARGPRHGGPRGGREGRRGPRREGKEPAAK
jgi:Spy/CpxP family protein refolding chaperone